MATPPKNSSVLDTVLKANKLLRANLCISGAPMTSHAMGQCDCHAFSSEGFPVPGEEEPLKPNHYRALSEAIGRKLDDGELLYGETSPEHLTDLDGERVAGPNLGVLHVPSQTFLDNVSYVHVANKRVVISHHSGPGPVTFERIDGVEIKLKKLS